MFWGLRESSLFCTIRSSHHHGDMEGSTSLFVSPVDQLPRIHHAIDQGGHPRRVALQGCLDQTLPGSYQPAILSLLGREVKGGKIIRAHPLSRNAGLVPGEERGAMGNRWWRKICAEQTHLDRDQELHSESDFGKRQRLNVTLSFGSIILQPHRWSGVI